MLESQLEKLFLTGVRTVGGLTFKTVSAAGTGMPDRLVLLPGGRIMLVELKTEKGTLSPKQRHWHQQAEGLGVTVVTLYGPADVRSWLQNVRTTPTPRVGVTASNHPQPEREKA